MSAAIQPLRPWRAPCIIEEVAKPTPPKVVDPRGLPALVQFTRHEHARWVGWKYESVDGKTGKWTKVPKQVNGRNASSNNPATWSTFKDVWDGYAAGMFDGIGLMLLGLPNFGAIDLDKIRDPQTGTLMPWVETLIAGCGSYCEITPSLAGLRVLGKWSGGKVHRNGPHPGGGNFELFADCERFITFTGMANGTAERWGDISAVVGDLLQLRDKKQKSPPNGQSIDPNGRSIDLESLPPIVVELLVRGTLNGEPVKKRGPAFARIVHALRAGGHSFAAALAMLVKYPNGVQAKYGARIATEAQRMWNKVELREGYKSKGFICSAFGGPVANVANAITALRLSPKWQDSLEYDLFAEKLLYDDEPWESFNSILAAEWLQHNEVNVTPHVAGQAAYAVGRDNKRHPVRDYLAGLVWDGVKRIDKWLTDYLGVKPEPVEAGDKEGVERVRAEQDYLAAIGSKFLIGCVARVMRPGCKADCALVLEGPQGALKSTAIMALLPNKGWFTDELADLGSKDAALQLAGRWIIEWSELDSYSRAEVARVKAYMSRQEDKFRPPYAETTVERPRQCCFIGTTNQKEYLRDETGGRRFWPAWCGKIDVAALKRDRDQLWAEAFARFNEGESWWLDADVEKQAKVEQEARRIEDPWEPLIAEAIATNECVTVNALLNKVLGVPVERQDQAAANRCSRCLRALGWERKQAGSAGEFKIYNVPQTIKRGDWMYIAPKSQDTWARRERARR